MEISGHICRHALIRVPFLLCILPSKRMISTLFRHQTVREDLSGINNPRNASNCFVF